MWFVNAFRDHPELAIFACMALGFLIGRFSIKGVAIGAVTGTLLAGVLIGQLKIEIPDLVKTVAFIGFLFALGYRVGPQFFAGLRKGGVPQVILAVTGCVFGLIMAYAMAKIMGYGPGWGAGLLAGGLTQSAVIGDAINQSSTISAADKQTFTDQIPVGYAVCYLVGTAAAAYFLSQIAPRILGTRDLAAEAAAMEKKLGTFRAADTVGAYQQVVRRTFKVTPGSELDGTAVAAEEELAASRGRRIFIQRYRRGDQMAFTTPDTVLRAGDIVTVTASHTDFVAGQMEAVGAEVDDPELLSYDVEQLAVVVTGKKLDGQTLSELAASGAARNLFVRKIVRAGVEIPFGPSTQIHRGDEITVEGPKELVEKAIPLIGKPSRSKDDTDFSYIGPGIVLVGLIGIQSGPNFISGVKSEGLGLVFAGLAVTLVPMFLTLTIGKLVYKWPAVTNTGATAGTFTTTASIGAICDKAQSRVPVLSYTVPYAIGNVLLTIWGSVIVALLS